MIRFHGIFSNEKETFDFSHCVLKPTLALSIQTELHLTHNGFENLIGLQFTQLQNLDFLRAAK